MRNLFLLVLAAAALLLMVPAANAQAQSETPKVEIGAHYTHLRLPDFETGDHGVGLRLTLFELYPSRRVASRFDVGDTIIRFSGPGFTSHNLQITSGIALRF